MSTTNKPPVAEFIKTSTSERNYETVDDVLLPMVLFCNPTENKALQYIDLHEIQLVESRPDVLRCHFSEWEVVIEGRALVTMLEDLTRHRVFRIRAEARYSDMKQYEGWSFATAITFKKREADQPEESAPDQEPEEEEETY